jgi:carnitine O-acetyltransferase
MSPELSTAVRFAESRLADLLHQHEMHALDFHGYGKNFITSMGFSPDAFVQMAFQAAYYGLYGRVENTYEPAMTKLFLHGRTEAIRTVTPECVNFVQKFWGDNPPGEKAEALKKATEKHTAITKQCAQGQGHDRHLYALYSLWQRSLDDMFLDGSSVPGTISPSESGFNVGSFSSVASSEDETAASSYGSSRKHPATAPPALFNDAGWDKINSTILSTSNCGNPCLRHFGFGPTSADGFGIGYIIKDESISICASSKHRQTERFMQTLESYLHEIRKLLRATQRVPPAAAARPKPTPDAAERTKSTGRLIKPEVHQRGTETPTTVSEEMEDDGMGGCKWILLSLSCGDMY